MPRARSRLRAIVVALTLVKRCPGCSAEHPPNTLRCACGLLLVGVDLVEPGTVEAAPDPVSAVPSADVTALLCPHADCAQTNPAESTLCKYCNRPLTSRLWLEWPWGERELLRGETLIGRTAPALPALIERLERDYDNVSRRHALLRLDASGASVEDLGSSNGTFINDVRLQAHRAVRLHEGARLRFGAKLVVKIDAGK